jgi:hypothetical protein
VVSSSAQDPPTQPISQQPSEPNVQPVSNATSEPDRTSQSPLHAKVSEAMASMGSTPTPLNTSLPPSEPSMVTPTNPKSSAPTIPANLSLSSAMKNHAHGQDSPVMNETLSVINEHITDMHAPRHNNGSDRRGTNDSGSEYSSNIDHRLSYINGEETDEEEEQLLSEEEVSHWTPDQVADYLHGLDVDEKHCNVFRDQEITGDVLLGMDQESLFIKEFELGSVGRRFKTWQKIKALQDEAKGLGTGSQRNTAGYGSEISSEDGKFRSRSNTGATVLPRIPSLMERPGSRQTSRRVQGQNSRPTTATSPPISPSTATAESPRLGENRPSAASVRELGHSRRHSSVTDIGVGSLAEKLADAGLQASLGATAHKKQPSFDRNWTMGSATPSISSRPLSSAGLQESSIAEDDSLSGASTPFELDRGYFSGGEVEGRKRNVLKKRDSAGAHSRKSSYTDEQRVRSATAHTRHSRFGSVDSLRDPPVSSAAQRYYGSATNGRQRTPSAEVVRPMPPPKDVQSPTVTKLEGAPYAASATSPKSQDGTRSPSDWLLPTKSASKSRGFGLRAISDAVTGTEKARATTPNDAVPPSIKDSPLESPSRTGSSTPSAGQTSFELESTESSKSPSSLGMTPGRTVAPRKKSKKETSAYTRGLEKKTPQEQMIGCDYSGWMKKKSTNLMTTWKPRLFVLKGRRLSYYYSENDMEEKGLIDISFHRVLPADTDRITGLHATLTGATNSPASPQDAQTPTIASTEAASTQSTVKSSSDSMFIFKLVPPRAGLSRAVNFTKPTVHYFAVPNIAQGRLWMAALMKATIDRDDSKAVTTTYQQKTISLAKARQMRHRPPALMNLDEKIEEDSKNGTEEAGLKTPKSDRHGLNIQGIVFDEGDSGVSGVDKLGSARGATSLEREREREREREKMSGPQTA